MTDNIGSQAEQLFLSDAFEGMLYQAYQQLAYWWNLHHSCPCGARAESLDTHPHMILCPTEAGLKWLADGGYGEDAEDGSG